MDTFYLPNRTWNNWVRPPSYVPRGPILDAAKPERLSRALASADLQAIRSDYQKYRADSFFTEGWLGYLGVALERSGLLPTHKQHVGLAWRRQLDRMAGVEWSQLRPVTFEELEEYESRLRWLPPGLIRLGPPRTSDGRLNHGQ